MHCAPVVHYITSDMTPPSCVLLFFIVFFSCTYGSSHYMHDLYIWQCEFQCCLLYFCSSLVWPCFCFLHWEVVIVDVSQSQGSSLGRADPCKSDPPDTWRGSFLAFWEHNWNASESDHHLAILHLALHLFDSRFSPCPEPN